jgi:ribulose-5-phosphate 4-epimerase/fuculose-1-phosphate aldolase
MSSAPALTRPLPVRDVVSDEEWQLRVELAACYRLMAHFGVTDIIYNHITARVPGSDHHFLINSYGMLYEEVTASSLQKIDVEGNVILQANNEFGLNRAGFVIHSAVHMARENAACVIHTHSRAASAVAAMKCGLLPLSQSATLFYDEVSYHDFEGPAIDLDERERLVRDLGKNDVMLLRNHGTLVVGRSVPHAFLMSYQLENACKIQVDAMSGGELVLPTPEIAARSPVIARQPAASPGAGLEWKALLRLLDRKYPGYAD